MRQNVRSRVPTAASQQSVADTPIGGSVRGSSGRSAPRLLPLRRRTEARHAAHRCDPACPPRVPMCSQSPALGRATGNCHNPAVQLRSSAWGRGRRPAVTSQMAGQRAARQLTAGRGRGPGSNLTASPPRACRCPVAGCGEPIDPSRLMCRGHWSWCPERCVTGCGPPGGPAKERSAGEHLKAVGLAIAAC
jgi:hypothetical protein